MDIFGNALRDRHAGETDQLLTIKRDDGHTDAHDPALYFEADPFSHEIALLSQVRGPALDVGCGAGRTLLWLKQQGITATGIDLSAGAVAVAKQRGCPDVHQGDILNDPMTTLGPASFESVILFGNNLGIGGTLEGAATLLRTLHRLTKPCGQLFVTGLDIAQTNDPKHLAYHRANTAKGRPIGEIKMQFIYKGQASDWVKWFHPEPKELDALARQTGWDISELSTLGPFYQAVLRKA